MRRHDYSQHFLRNPHFVQRLVYKTGITGADVVYDLGAGSGVITSALARRAGRVVAVELEQAAAKKLHANTQAYSNVLVIEDDILTTPLPNSSYKVVANIPFHLSSQIVRRLTESANSPSECFLIVQKQFAQKLVLDNSHFTGALAMMIAPWFTVGIVQALRRSDFSPPPAVDTVLMKITRRQTALLSVEYAADYRQFIADCYHDPKVFAKTPRTQLGIMTDRKPSQLSVDEWVRLFQITKC
jgi:23S rRNA (adenine-N6)-dimethyltransferase